MSSELGLYSELLVSCRRLLLLDPDDDADNEGIFGSHESPITALVSLSGILILFSAVNKINQTSVEKINGDLEFISTLSGT